jgi:hypothetical protein
VRRIAVLGAAVAVTIDATASAQPLVTKARPRVLELNWVEQRSNTSFPIAMTYKVKRVTIGKKAWSVRASFTNRSKKAILITRHSENADYTLFSFALAVPSYIQSGAGPRPTVTSLNASYARPTFPTFLLPGRTWNGVFGGPGLPPKGKLINVVFGVFSAPGEQEWSWITDHAFKL